MTEKLPFTRREFLQGSLALMSTLGTVPGFLAHASAAPNTAAARGALTAGRTLVIIQLSGGNDGLNTVVPAGMDDYYRQRGGLAIPAGEVLTLDDRVGIGLHPALRPIQEMYLEGQATVVQGVGYPNPNRSHFASMDVWHAGDSRAADGHRGVGWIGRAFDQELRRGRSDSLSCVTIGEEAPMATQGREAKPVSFTRADLFSWSGKDLHDQVASAYDGLHEGLAPASNDDPVDFVFRTALDARAASTRVRRAVARDSQTDFPNNGLGRQLRAVSSMIAAELPTRIYYVALGGFDTHANQAGTHNRLLDQLATSVRAFYRELEAIGQSERVVTMAFSEFGRRVKGNGSNGTDHGTAGPVLLFGPKVRAGLIGSHPSLTDLDNGDLKFRVDFRSIYSALLDDWLGLDARAALGQRFRSAPVLEV
ncbi:DUF1501 domain-containing protein [Mucisphaera calidilacus]|uniref:DUF1501 domain-containing protein n=1 Tax=Mucisphaera calidilacus TaxID=2527982 RepID=A0A518BT88_9BACT|nr:DUF1501 domain-containing protein [Mucisphaera calidilacus]QDU70188.1 hypothetical protein Pan265_00100 [Mucisphaera calidilacus]